MLLLRSCCCMSHCLLKEQQILLFNFVSVSLISFPNKKQKKLNQKKPQNQKKFRIKKIQNSKGSELRKFRAQNLTLTVNLTVSNTETKTIKIPFVKKNESDLPKKNILFQSFN